MFFPMDSIFCITFLNPFFVYYVFFISFLLLFFFGSKVLF